MTLVLLVRDLIHEARKRPGQKQQVRGGDDDLVLVGGGALKLKR